jgi:hypothetical protein
MRINGCLMETSQYLGFTSGSMEKADSNFLTDTALALKALRLPSAGRKLALSLSAMVSQYFIGGMVARMSNPVSAASNQERKPLPGEALERPLTGTLL